MLDRIHTTGGKPRLRSCRATTLVVGLLAAAHGIALQAAQAEAQSAHRAPARPKVASEPAAPRVAPLTAEEQATQILNRFTFGPRPGEISSVARIGWESWFEQQLNPSAIADAALDKRLAQYPALGYKPQQLAILYPDGQIIRRIDEGKLGMPEDPQLAAVYEVLLARYHRKQAEDKADAAPAAQASPAAQAGGGQKPPAPNQTPGAVTPAPQAATPEQVEASKQARKQQEKQQDQIQAHMLADQILGYPKNLRMQAILRLPVEQRLQLAAGVVDPEKKLLTDDMTPHERELFQMMAGGYGGNGVVANEMQQAKILRAVLSERQLQEVMTDFWFNHFNIDLNKSGDEIEFAPSYERDAIRAHSLGKFRDLLVATAQHPAMLIYLDNFQSIGPDSQAAGRPKPGVKNAQQRGLNENYGREVMELHTLGVDGGYTQADVTNLAKILTGWTIDQPQMGGGFFFDPRKHEPGAKQWYGQKIDFEPGPAGIDEGMRALNALAASPKTAHFISYELAQRFVSDTPPPAMVARMAAAYLSSDGDIKTVLRAMVHSPEFFSRANYRNKVKMPLEYVASSLRATGTDPTNPGALNNELRTMGEPLYRCLPPTGYASTADRWMNSSALVDRLNYALQLTGGRFGGMRFDAPRLLAAGLLSRPGATPTAPLAHTVAIQSQPGPAIQSGQEEALALMERLLVPGAVSEKTNAIIRQQLDGPQTDSSVAQSPSQVSNTALAAGNTSAGAAGLAPGSPAPMPAPMPDAADTLDKLAAMILGSPEFQVH